MTIKINISVAIHAGEALKQAEDIGFPVAIAMCNLENAHVMYGLKDQKHHLSFLRFAQGDI